MKTGFDRKFIIYIVILLLAFAVRLWDIDARSLWFDEAFEYWSAIVNIRDIPITVSASFQPPLYTFLLHFWLFFGKEAFLLRFLSVIFSLFTLMGLMLWDRKMFGVKGGVVAGAILIMLPTEIRYAQEVAEYALMICMLTWAMFSLYLAHKSNIWKYWILWGGFSIAAVYSHYGAAIVIFATGGAVFAENLIGFKFSKLKRQIAVAVGGLGASVPLIYFFLIKQISRQQPSVTPLHMGHLVSEIERFVVSLENTFNFYLTGYPFLPLPKWLGLIAIYSILFFSIVMLFHKSVSRDVKRVVGWFWIAYMVYYLAVRIGLYAYGNYGFRYGLILLPLFVLLIVAIYFIPLKLSVRDDIIKIPYLLFILFLMAYSLPNRTLSQITRGNSLWPETQNIQKNVEYWAKYRNLSEPTYIYYGAVPAFRYYLRLDGVESDFPLPPLWFSECWRKGIGDSCSTDNIFYGKWFRADTPEEKLASIEDTLGEDMPEKFWMMFSHIYVDEDKTILNSLESRYKIKKMREDVNSILYFFEKR